MMKGKKTSQREAKRLELDKMKQESSQSASKNKSKKQNQIISSTMNPKPPKWNTYEPWGQSSTIASKSDGWGSNAQTWAKTNGNNPWQSKSKTASLDDPWDDNFPRLGAEAPPPPRVNVWEERKFKAESIKALEPQNQYDEEAMLKQALELSLLVAKEDEEKRRREEEAYELQMKALRLEEEEKARRRRLETLKIEKEQNSFQLPSPPLSSRSDLKSSVTYQPIQEKKSLDTNSNIKFTSEFIKESKGSNSGGARPKINKVIERFGGWGLSEKDKKTKIHSDERNKPKKLVDLVDNILEDDKPSTKCESVIDQVFEREGGKISQDLHSSKALNPWGSLEADDETKTAPIPSSSSNSDKILFDGRGTSTDLSIEDDLDSFDSGETFKHASFCDSTVTRNEKLKNTEMKDSTETQTQVNRKNEDLGQSVVSADEESVLQNNPGMKEQNEFTSNSYNLFENTYNYVPSDSLVSDSHQTVDYKTPSIPSRDPWADTALKTVVNVEPFPSKINCENSELKSEPLQFNNFSGKTIHTLDELSPRTSFKASDSFSQLNTMHPETLANEEIPVSDVESQILPPQPLQTVPPFPLVNNPMFASNPVFPGSMNFSPMYGYVMDSMMMQQMLLLNNPYFASQLLAMEQYYRSMGLHSNVFSFQPQVIPNPGTSVPSPHGSDVFDTTSEQSLAHNVMNSDMPANTFNPDFQNSSLTDLSKSVPGNANCETSDKLIKPPGLDISIAQTDISNANMNEEDDCWFKSYLCSEDTLPIPPPKPAALNVDECNNSVPIPKNLETSSSSFNSVKPNGSKLDDFSYKAVSSTQEIKLEKSSLNAFKTSETKTAVHGWSDLEDEFIDSTKPKSTYSWDDGWGNDSMPSKPIKSSTVSEDRKKTAYRQPASQPQVSRFQRNKMYK